MTTRLSTVIIVAILAVVVASLPAKAVVLTFNPSDGVSGDVSLPTYGDNVAGSSQDGFTYYNLGEGWTPDISLSFSTTAAGTYHTYNDAVWTGVIESDGRYVVFTPANGASVKINDLNMESYGGGTISYLKIVTLDGDGNETGTLQDVIDAPSGFPIASGPTGQLISVNYTGAPGQTIALTFGGGIPANNVGIDTLRFSEMIPEPASLGLMGLGSLSLLRRKRR